MNDGVAEKEEEEEDEENSDEEEDDDDDDDDEDDDDEDTDNENTSGSKASDTSSSISSPTLRRNSLHAQGSHRGQKKDTAIPPKSNKTHRTQVIKTAKEQKKVSTRRLTSISAAGAASDDSRIVCHRCMMKGHKLKDCPKMVRVGDKREQRGQGFGAGAGAGVRGGKGYKRAPMGLL